MTILLWWALASTGVSLLVGAFLGFGRHDAETIDLDVGAPATVTPPAVGALTDH